MQDRYSRQVILQNIGEEGQEIFLKSRVAVVGCGALGTVVANNLVRAGIGRISIIDRDFVELNNLQRQMLFEEGDVGTPKAIAAAERLRRINSKIEVEPVVADLNHTNVQEMIKDVDLVLDGTDNIQTRMVMNDACVKNGIPWIYTAAIGTFGMTMNILLGGACLACLFPDLPEAGSLPTCDTMGVLNTVTTIIASIESTEAMKILLGRDVGRDLIIYDAWGHHFDTIAVKKNEACECCGERDFRFLNAEKREIITSLCGRNAIQITPAKPAEISFESLAERFKRLGEVRYNDFMLIFNVGGREISLFKDGRAIVKGTDDEKVARSLYARYVGI